MSQYDTPNAAMKDEMLTHGAIPRRIAAFVIDGVILVVLWLVLHTALLVFGVLTLGLGMPLLLLLPVVPPLYNWLGLVSSLSATPGQALLGLAVRRNDDMGPPGALAAAVWVGGFYLSLALSGLPLLLVLFSDRRRAAHDIVAGLAVVRSQALTPDGGFWNMAPGGPHRP